MRLPGTFLFLRPGWWLIHLAGPAVVFAGGVGLGIFHASDAPDPALLRLEAAKAAVPALGSELKTRLQAAIAEGGPEGAVGVCADEAREITGRIAAERDVSVGRSSLRLRNPANAAPDWVAAWLAEQGERPAAGVDGFARVEIVDGEPVARVLKPIVVETLCLSCHGPNETLSSPVRFALAERYPTDAATGYAVGDLRGAVWAEAPVRGSPLHERRTGRQLP